MLMAEHGTDAPALLFENPKAVAGPRERQVGDSQPVEQQLSQFQGARIGRGGQTSVLPVSNQVHTSGNASCTTGSLRCSFSVPISG